MKLLKKKKLKCDELKLKRAATVCGSSTEVICVWKVNDKNTDITGVWIRWIDNKLCLEYSCECCGHKTNKVFNKTIYYSFAEKAVLYYIHNLFPNVLNNYKADWLCGCELDIFIPDLNVGVEIDGAVYHKNTSKDKYKNIICADNIVKLIRIRDFKCAELSDGSACIKCTLKEDKSLSRAILQCLALLGIDGIDIDVKRDRRLIEQFVAMNILKELKRYNENIYCLSYVCNACLLEFGICGVMDCFSDGEWIV